MIHDTILLLSACINPNGMSYTEIQNPKERESHYLNALSYYLKKTKYKIVFVNNSGEDISYKVDNRDNRIEFLSFYGNDYDKSYGKGYGEFLILQYAFKNSVFISKCNYVIKITGRLIVKNITEISTLNDFIFFIPRRKVYVECINNSAKHIESKCIIASKKFYTKFFLEKKNVINDAVGYYFEHLLYDVIEQQKSVFFVSEFCEPLAIEGVSGTSRYVYDYIVYSFPQKMDNLILFCHRYLDNHNASFFLSQWIKLVSYSFLFLKYLYKIRRRVL